MFRPQLGQAERSHGGIGEDHGGHGGQIQRRIAAGHVDRGPGAGSGGHIDILRLVGAVASGEDALHRGAQVIVDDDGPVRRRLHANAFQRQPVGIGPPARGHQQPVAANLARPGQEDELFAIVSDGIRQRMQQNLRALLLQRLCQPLAKLGVFLRQQHAAGQNRHLRAQPQKRLRQLQRHHRCADDEQMRGQCFRDQRLGRSPVGRLRQARNGRNRGAGAAGDEDAIRGEPLFATIGADNDQRLPILEMRPAPDQRNRRIGFQNALVLGVAQLLDPPLLLPHQRRAVDARDASLDAVERMMRLIMRHLRAANHDLRRHAADIDAGAANDLATLDDRYARALFRRADRRGKGSRARADDRHMQRDGFSVGGTAIGHFGPLFMPRYPPF